ncbi:MAG: hypothetical protein EA350_09410 [Gemmatimonadales bacterium]|nr:MAG: hypothetical protein EA350_09410 [Gemmatimonadales bacterium]
MNHGGEVCLLTSYPVRLGGPEGERWMIRLAECIRIENSLLQRLEAVLLAQRAAVESDHLLAVEDGTHATRKILRTLAEARRHRASVLQVGTGDPAIALDDVASMGVELSDVVQDERARLRETARRVHLTLALNRVLLGEAARASDRAARTLLGSTPSVTFAPPGQVPASGASVDGGRHLNRTV